MTRFNTTSIVIGASGGIGAAITQALLNNPSDSDNTATRVLAVSRQSAPFQHPHLTWLQSRSDEPSIADTAKRLNQHIQSTPAILTRVIICSGMLHNLQQRPEKRLEDLTLEHFTQSLQINALTPLLWLQQLMPLLRQAQECKIAILSARVGSIADNRLGGWYSYRASKAALNMMLKNASIELARRAKGVKLISFHPGTTDTSLSRPFQANVPPKQLFAPEFVAQRLLSLIQSQPIDGQLSFIDWAGKSIDW